MFYESSERDLHATGDLRFGHADLCVRDAGFRRSGIGRHDGYFWCVYTPGGRADGYNIASTADRVNSIHALGQYQRLVTSVGVRFEFRAAVERGALRTLWSLHHR